MSLKTRASSNNQRARELRLAYNLHEHDLKFMLDYFEGKCAYCGCELTNKNFWVDHIIPISEEDNDTINFGSVAYNILPTCSDCNIAKGDKALGVWLKSHVNNYIEVLERIAEYQLECGIDEIIW